MGSTRKPSPSKDGAYSFNAELMFHSAGWHYVTMPEDQSTDLREAMDGLTAGFGSIRVEVTVHETSWLTSVFPMKTGTYFLPVKKQIRTAHDLLEGDMIDFHVRVVSDPR